ncbi:hypothetical protein [Methylobacterium nigriterrae]|uniref:hypothetical protein n=1 Tax=Methylobacterium nigriterrae TaxID=3127512 RepID=UPI0030138F0D
MLAQSLGRSPVATALKRVRCNRKLSCGGPSLAKPEGCMSDIAPYAFVILALTVLIAFAVLG